MASISFTLPQTTSQLPISSGWRGDGGPGPRQDAVTLDELRLAGQAFAASEAAVHQRDIARHVRRKTRNLRRVLYSGLSSTSAPRLHQDWLTGNARLIVSTEKDLRSLAANTRGFPIIQSISAAPVLRVCALADAFLDAAQDKFDEEGFIAFVGGVQEVHDLEMGEAWAAKPALQLGLLERIVRAVTSSRADLPVLITSLRSVTESRWKDVFAAINVVDRVLARDPAGAYAAMDDESRDQYRHLVSDLAKHSGRSERDVAEVVISLAAEAQCASDGSRAAERRTHVGFYLIDSGLARLRARVGYRCPIRQRIVDAACEWPTLVYVGGVLAATLILTLSVLTLLGPGATALAAIILLAFPATQAAVELIQNVVSSVVPPRRLAKLDFSEGIPDEYATMIAVPAILLNERHVRELVMDMEIRFLANRDPNLSFALVTNSRDSDQRAEERNEALQWCERLVRELNERYGTDGRTPFYLFHRRLAFNASEGRWMGWERKRGKLLDLNQLLRGVRDRFPAKVGNLEALPQIRYVITLDSDTELPRDAARRLVGTMAHPLNRAVIDPVTKTVVEGYGILQPRISVSTQSATRSWLANLYSGDTGFDIYTRAVSDVYQDLFGEGIFTGKGIYEVDAFRESLEHRFPANTLLSHDLIEGVFARAGLVSDIELVDDYPTHFSAYCRRKHRWMRGDWQVLRWLLNRVPDYRRQLVPNPLSAISRWKIFDNLRRSMLEPAALAMLLAAWFFFSGSAVAWTAAAIALLLLPAYFRLLISLASAPWWTAAFRPWAIAALSGLLRTHLVVGLHVIYLLHDALLAVDAIGRSLARMFVTHRRLLEWETAAEAALRTRGATDVHLKRSPYLAAALGIALWWIRPESLPAAAPVLALWISARGFTKWLNQPPRSRTADLNAQGITFLRDQALRTWRYFREFSSAGVNWLVPDFVRKDGLAANRLSPTNLAFLLNARIAAVHFGYLTLTEFAELTRQSLTTMLRLPRYRGHLLNWYDAENLATLEPRFISTVDSGNLVAALWALKEASLAWSREAPSSDLLWDGVTDVARMIGTTDNASAQALSERVLKASAQWRQTLPELEALVSHFAADAEGEAAAWARELIARLQHAQAWSDNAISDELRAQLVDIAATAEAFAAEMDFAFLYDARRKVLSVGFDVNTSRLDRGSYDLLASEARIASFVAIAKGDIPQESWFHLGRAHVAVLGERVLLSWTGTLFEYLMPALWFGHRPGTIVRQSMHAAVAAQRRFARQRHIPWGFSESGYVIPGSSEYGYAACGVPELALKPVHEQKLVVSAYSSYLALLVDPRAALANLRQLEQMGCVGTYGFYEAVDYSHGTPTLVKSWMAHHQGMILLASAEALFGYPFQNALHANPHVRATERLLDERLPRTIVADAPEEPRLLMPEESVA